MGDRRSAPHGDAARSVAGDTSRALAWASKVTDAVGRIDEDRVLEAVSILPNAGGIPDDDFTITYHAAIRMIELDE